MSLNPTTLNVVLTSGETNTYGAVTGIQANFTHQSASAGAPLTNGTSTSAAQASHSQAVTGTATTGGVTIDLTAIAGGLDGKTRDWSNGGSGGVIKTFIFENLDSTHTITIGQPGSNGWTGIGGQATGLAQVVGPGGIVTIHQPIAGLAVGATNKSFTLTSDAGTPAYKMTIVGVAA